MLQDALDQMEDLNEYSDSATAYIKVETTLGDAPSGLVSVLRGGRRQFRSFLESPQLLRTIEVQEGMPVGVCTIDLRAWGRNAELCWVIDWEDDSFRVGMWSPDESQQFWASSLRVLQLDR